MSNACTNMSEYKHEQESERDKGEASGPCTDSGVRVRSYYREWSNQTKLVDYALISSLLQKILNVFKKGSNIPSPSLSGTSLYRSLIV